MWNNQGYIDRRRTAPSATEFGQYVKCNEGNLKGEAYAYLIAADRCNHIEEFIKPQLKKYDIVVCDRYIESSFVLQSFDGVEYDDIWRMNCKFIIPDLSIVLFASEATLQYRLDCRNEKSFFEKMMTRKEEIEGYHKCVDFLKDKGYNMGIFYNEKEAEGVENLNKCYRLLDKIMGE